MTCSGTLADNAYVSPESYAVNDDEVREMYQKLMAPLVTPAQEVTQQQKYNPADDKEKGIRATLRRIRYNSMNPYHGEKHQIKVNSTADKK